MRRGPTLALVAAVASATTGATLILSGIPGVSLRDMPFRGDPPVVAAHGEPKWLSPEQPGTLLTSDPSLGSAQKPGAATEPDAAPTGPRLRPRPVAVGSPGFWSWALLDLGTGTIVGSPNLHVQSDTASMIKAWIAADQLRRTAEKNATPARATLTRLSTMIRDSDNPIAVHFHAANGGAASIKRMIGICRLTDSAGNSGGWSTTKVSARDAARLAACLADGRAAGPAWTPWLLGEMRQVRGPGRFGVIQALPPEVARTTAIKNGWLLRKDGQWHISCLAVGEGWALGVLARYPGRLGKAHGERICRGVGEQLMS